MLFGICRWLHNWFNIYLLDNDEGLKMIEPLEKLLDESPMGDYVMYTKEDLIDFAALVVKRCAAVAMVATDDNFPVDNLFEHFGVEE